MKNFILSLLLSISAVLGNFSLQAAYSVHTFSSSEVKSTIDYLSSSTFKGRLAGTMENKLAEKYIENEFKKANLLPFGGQYIQTFDSAFPEKTQKSPYLRVVNSKGNIVTEYKYAVDYKEDMLNFRQNYISFTKDSPVHATDSSLQVISNSEPFIFFVPDNDNLNFRSSFIKDSAFSMCIMTTKKTLNDLKDYISKGCKVQCYIPYEIKETKLDNVLGVIKGMDSTKPPLILSGHFDHIGTDLSGNIYNGALDNASGISFVMEMSKYIYSLGTPERDIVFIAFNAEEFGCLGSKAFVEKYSPELKGSKVFNFDMIGSDNGIPLCIMGSKTDNAKSPLIRSVSATCSNQNIKFNYLFEDASDHEYFRKYNIDAITFCDNDMSRIHTPEDKIDYITSSAIKRCFNVASREVIKYGFQGNFALIYYREMLIGSILSSAIILLTFNMFKKRERG